MSILHKSDCKLFLVYLIFACTQSLQVYFKFTLPTLDQHFFLTLSLCEALSISIFHPFDQSIESHWVMHSIHSLTAADLLLNSASAVL